MTEKKRDQEIDLLSLFSIASKKFNSFLYFIINLFISFLNLFISLLTLIKKSYLLLLSALIIGGFIGNILQKKFFGPTYTSTLTLAPNFGSTYQHQMDWNGVSYDLFSKKGKY